MHVALSNLKAQSCVSTILVNTSGLARNSTIANGSYRNPKVGGEKEMIEQRAIMQTIADICKFVTDQCCHVDGQFFYTGSELAREKFEKLRNWRTSSLDMNDYKLSDIFE